ncbi:MAG: hypothetical protein MUC61_01115 [Amoebophilaceae bacterium]|nr:hypothetical protein [Amoebophilaceae bacterium]
MSEYENVKPIIGLTVVCALAVVIGIGVGVSLGKQGKSGCETRRSLTSKRGQEI